MGDVHPKYVVTLRAEDDDGIRGLRWLLKAALRRFRLRCIDVREEHQQKGGNTEDKNTRPTSA
jgi:hypothetical protein